MPAIVPASVPVPAPREEVCPHCGSTVGRTLLKRNQGIKEVDGIRVSVPMNSQWRCFGCGRNFTTTSQ